MKCMDPVLCYTDPNGKKRFRHFSLANPIFKYHLHQQVFNCGKCLFCRKRKAYELAARCVLHASLYIQNSFITLTYDETKEGYHNEFQYSDIQKFKKRLRAHCWRVYKKKIEIFNVHEYGKNGKKHWHLVVFNHDYPDKKLFTTRNGIPYYTSEKLSQHWPHGHHTIGDVTEASAMYQAQYVQKDFKNGNISNGRNSHSRHSGIGKKYFLRHYQQLLRLGYIPINGKRLPMPRYFERLAFKHYSHFYEPQNFHDYPERKRLFAPFKGAQKNDEANREIADLYIKYSEMKQEKIQQLTTEWEEFIQTNSVTKETPEFVKSGENALYDLKNKTTKENF